MSKAALRQAKRWHYRRVRAIHRGIRVPIPFDKVVFERNNHGIQDIPDKIILEIIYELGTCTTFQIQRVLNFQFKQIDGNSPLMNIQKIMENVNLNNLKMERDSIAARINKLKGLRLCTRYQLEYEENDQPVMTPSLWMLDVNGRSLLEGENQTNIFWHQKRNISINTYPEVHLEKLITNQLIAQYIKASKDFVNFKISPKIIFDHKQRERSIRPNALLQFEKNNIMLYALRRSPGWQEKIMKESEWLEKYLLNFKPSERIPTIPGLMFLCEDEVHVKEMNDLISTTNLPKEIIFYTTDLLINEDSLSKSIIVVTEKQGKIVLAYPELPNFF